ncbi:9009_t:CDS:1, partial [Dentiscutata heterogama]
MFMFESSDIDITNKLLDIDESKASMIEDHTVWTEELYKRLTDLW